jgi:hypothetical protein
MPFDCTPITDAPKQAPTLDGHVITFDTRPPDTKLIIARPIPAWHTSRRPEYISDALAVLARARELIADEDRWCRRSFARSWLNIPVPVQSVAARRFCTIGAIMHAGRKLGVRIEEARNVLEWHIARPIEQWNDDPERTHAEVIAAFDGAIAALDGSTL